MESIEGGWGQKGKVECEDATKGRKEEECALPIAKEVPIQATGEDSGRKNKALRKGVSTTVAAADVETVALLFPLKPPLVALSSILETMVLQAHNSWIIPFHAFSFSINSFQYLDKLSKSISCYVQGMITCLATIGKENESL